MGVLFEIFIYLCQFYRVIIGHMVEEKTKQEALWHIGEIFQLLPFGFLFNWFKASIQFLLFSLLFYFVPRTHVIDELQWDDTEKKCNNNDVCVCVQIRGMQVHITHYFLIFCMPSQNRLCKPEIFVCNVQWRKKVCQKTNPTARQSGAQMSIMF